MQTLHHINILIHVFAGTLALLAGFTAVFVRKGGKAHRSAGVSFARMMFVLIGTGLFGVFVFHRNTFLLVITLLSGYNCFSGIRVIRSRGHHPRPVDQLLPILVLATAVYYLYYIRSIGLYWSPVIIYSTIGALALVALYDLSRVFFSPRLLAQAAPYEHVYKMISALSGISSAFCGTVFPGFQPYSQFLPSLIGLAGIIIIFIRFSTISTCARY